MTLGTDAAGVDEDGNEVVVHPVVGLTGHGLAPGEARSILTEKYQGTFAEQVTVPTANLVPKPPELSFAEAACLPTAWLTAYRMLFTQARARPGDTVLVQGAGGGVATAAITLARAAGLRVYATSRDPRKRARARTLGATDALPPCARLPHPADAVLETVGAATWSHSVRSLRPGGTLVLSGATTGDRPPAHGTDPHRRPRTHRHRLHDRHPRGTHRPPHLLHHHRHPPRHRPHLPPPPSRGGLRPPGRGRSEEH